MVSFKLFAGTNIGLRENNEDNFTVCPDLIKNEWIIPADNQQVIQLGSRGCLMVVADGMGGQNAGEVASAIAIDTVQEMFSPNQMSADVFDKSDAIKSFLKKVISECDLRIKQKTKEDSSTYGMGSTIVIAWLIGRKLYIAWLGDSRAYSYIKNKGIARLSKDHSYVQQLVDARAITDEEAMCHPNSNVITRSLGDSSQKAKADVVDYDIEDGQIILLCSDGLCGVCRDEEIGGIIEEEFDNLQKCKERLTTAALAAGGSDNITISLMQISKDATQSPKKEDNTQKARKISIPTILASVFGLCLLIILMYSGFSIMKPKEESVKSVKIWLDNDTLASKEKTLYHIKVIGDSVSTLIYDKNLIHVNFRDSVISVKKLYLLDDTITYVKAICKIDSTIVDSAPLVIKKNLEPSPKDKRVDNNGELLVLTNDSSDAGSNGTSQSNTITPSKNKQDSITTIEKKRIHH